MKKQITNYLIKEGFELVQVPDNSKEYFMFEENTNKEGFDESLIRTDVHQIKFTLGSSKLNYYELSGIAKNLKSIIDYKLIDIQNISQVLDRFYHKIIVTIQA